MDVLVSVMQNSQLVDPHTHWQRESRSKRHTLEHPLTSSQQPATV